PRRSQPLDSAGRSGGRALRDIRVAKAVPKLTTSPRARCLMLLLTRRECLGASKRLASPAGQPLGRWKRGVVFPVGSSGAYPALRYGASFQRGPVALLLRLRCEPGLTAPADGENHSSPFRGWRRKLSESLIEWRREFTSRSEIGCGRF